MPGHADDSPEYDPDTPSTKPSYMDLFGWQLASKLIGPTTILRKMELSRHVLTKSDEEGSASVATTTTARDGNTTTATTTTTNSPSSQSRKRTRVEKEHSDFNNDYSNNRSGGCSDSSSSFRLYWRTPLLLPVHPLSQTVSIEGNHNDSNNTDHNAQKDGGDETQIKKVLFVDVTFDFVTGNKMLSSTSSSTTTSPSSASLPRVEVRFGAMTLLPSAATTTTTTTTTSGTKNNNKGRYIQNQPLTLRSVRTHAESVGIDFHGTDPCAMANLMGDALLHPHRRGDDNDRHPVNDNVDLIFSRDNASVEKKQKHKRMMTMSTLKTEVLTVPPPSCRGVRSPKNDNPDHNERSVARVVDDDDDDYDHPVSKSTEMIKIFLYYVDLQEEGEITISQSNPSAAACDDDDGGKVEAMALLDGTSFDMIVANLYQQDELLERLRQHDDDKMKQARNYHAENYRQNDEEDEEKGRNSKGRDVNDGDGSNIKHAFYTWWHETAANTFTPSEKRVSATCSYGVHSNRAFKRGLSSEEGRTKMSLVEHPLHHDGGTENNDVSSKASVTLLRNDDSYKGNAVGTVASFVNQVQHEVSQKEMHKMSAPMARNEPMEREVEGPLQTSDHFSHSGLESERNEKPQTCVPNQCKRNLERINDVQLPTDDSKKSTFEKNQVGDTTTTATITLTSETVRRRHMHGHVLIRSGSFSKHKKRGKIKIGKM